MKLLLLATVAAWTLSSPAAAQMDMNMPGMKMPPKPAAKPAPKPKPAVQRAARPPATARPRTSARPAGPVVQHPAADAAPAPGNDGMTHMPGMAMPPATPAIPAPASNEHDMTSKPGMDMPKPGAPTTADPHAGHDMADVAGLAGTEPPDSEIGNTPAPAPPIDHAADEPADEGAGHSEQGRREQTHALSTRHHGARDEADDQTEQDECKETHDHDSGSRL